jgi:hypothetical protein
MTHAIFRLPRSVALDTSANLYAGAKLNFYATTTTTPQDTYTTSARNVAHANPVVADSAGLVPIIYLDPALTYKATYTTSADVLIYTQDPVNDSLLSQAVIGELLYPRTAGEISAGITPTNYAYPPGHFHRYGATGDGIAADATAVQSAFSSGATVTGINGFTYLCGNTTITVPAGARANLHGCTLTRTGTGTSFLSVEGDDVEIVGVEIVGAGNGAATTSSDALVRFSGASAASYRTGLILRDCYIREGGFYGVRCDFAQDILVTGCRFDDIAYAAFTGQSVTRARVNHNVFTDMTPGSSGNAYAITFTRTSGDTISVYPRSKDCEAIGNTINGITVWEALDTHGGDGIVFANNIIDNCLYGINVGPDTADSVAPLNCVVSGNVIRSGSTSADPGRAIGSGGFDASNKASNIVIIGNAIDGFGTNSNNDGAIMLQYTDGLVVANNIIEDSRASAICLLQDNDEFVVSGNSIRGIRNGVANAAGINIRNTTQTGHIADNYINATAEIGIFIANTNTGVTFGTNRIVTSGSRITDALYGGAGLEITGTTTTDVADILDGDQATVSITVTGAEIGDQVEVVASISLAGLGLSAYVSAADTVTAVLQNNSGGAINIASATYTAIVTKR